MRSIRRVGGLAIIALSVALLGSPASANADATLEWSLHMPAEDGGPGNSGDISDGPPVS